MNEQKTRSLLLCHAYAKIVVGVMVLVLCILSDDVLYLNQVSWKYLKGFRSY